MKIKKFKSKQILKLSLLKARGYEKNIINEKSNNSVLTQTSLTKTLTNFKKVLQIIFKYHQSEKKVLFIGFPKKLQFKINSLTDHVAVPENFDLQHFFLKNNSNVSKSDKNVKSRLMKTLTQDFSFKLARKPDLLVFASDGKTDKTFFESRTHKLPIIFFGTKNKDSKNIWLINSYKVDGIKRSSSNRLNQDLFFMGFNFLFKTLVSNKARKFNSFKKK